MCLIRGPGADGPWPVPVNVSCRGLRGQERARTVSDGPMTGIFSPGGVGRVREGIGPDIPLAVHAVCAVRDPDEARAWPRLQAAVGPVVAVALHQFAEQPWRREGLDSELRASAEAVLGRVDRDLDPARQHGHLPRGHLARLELAVDGVTESAVSPGDDVADERRRLASALGPAGLLRSPDGS